MGVEPKIVIDPGVMLGKPVIAGTRISVEIILERLGAGETIEDILEAYPHLSRESIQAALTFASQTLRNEIVYDVSV